MAILFAIFDVLRRRDGITCCERKNVFTCNGQSWSLITIIDLWKMLSSAPEALVKEAKRRK